MGLITAMCHSFLLRTVTHPVQTPRSMLAQHSSNQPLQKQVPNYRPSCCSSLSGSVSSSGFGSSPWGLAGVDRASSR